MAGDPAFSSIFAPRHFLSARRLFHLALYPLVPAGNSGSARVAVASACSCSCSCFSTRGGCKLGRKRWRRRLITLPRDRETFYSSACFSPSLSVSLHPPSTRRRTRLFSAWQFRRSAFASRLEEQSNARYSWRGRIGWRGWNRKVCSRRSARFSSDLVYFVSIRMAKK